MSDDTHNTNADVESEVWGAIAAFEQILEAMPEDSASLAALAHAYSQIGDHARATDYFVRLGEVLFSEKDHESAMQLVEKLRAYEADDRVRDLIARIEGVSAPTDAPDQSAAPAVDVAALSHFKVSEELALAWSLMESDELTQDEYASIVQDLTEMSAAGDGATVSVLHVLENRGFNGFGRILGCLARDSATPLIALGSYDFHFPTSSALPVDFCERRGACAFEAVGDELLVAVLNPHDLQLRVDVELVAGRPCHFYLAVPSDFDQIISRYRETVEHGSDQEE